jgi:carbonic anhydrase
VSSIDDLVAANAQYAAGLPGDSLPLPKGGKLAIVTCMDVRIETGRAFGLHEGDAYLIRNAGGRIEPAIPSLVVSQELLGTDEVAIIHHTDCGMTTFTDEDLRQRLASKGLDARDMVFGTFNELETSVRDDLRLYAECPLVRHDIPVRGFIFDVSTGLLREVG